MLLCVITASSNMASKHDELEPLYSAIQRIISEGLTSYERFIN